MSERNYTEMFCKYCKYYIVNSEINQPFGLESEQQLNAVDSYRNIGPSSAVLQYLLRTRSATRPRR